MKILSITVALLLLITGAACALTVCITPTDPTEHTAEIQVSWLPNPLDEMVAAYNVYRKAGDGPYYKLGSTPECEFLDFGVSYGRYFYKVSAEDTCGNISGMSPESPEALVKPAVSPPTGIKLRSWGP